MRGICDDVDTPECLCLHQQIVGHVVQLRQALLECGRELEIRLVDEVLMGRKEGCAQDCVIPVEDYASLANLGFILRPKPDLVISQP